MTIAITGASGQLGRLAIAALKTRVRADTILGLARDPSKLDDMGIATRAFDYNRPEDLAGALSGVTVLVLISSSEFGNRVGQHRAVIEAAKAAGVGRVVYTSILKGPASPLLVAADHIETEALLQASGLEWTILRNSWYMENWTASLPMALAHGAVIGSAGAGRVTPATRRDLAEALAVVAATPGHAGQAYELAGDEAFTLAELAAELSRQTGKDIPYSDMPAAAYEGVLDSLGLPPGLGAVIADADARAAEGWLFDDSKTLSRLIGRPTTTLAQAVAAALA